MVQVFMVVRCFSCQTFQVQQVQMKTENVRATIHVIMCYVFSVGKEDQQVEL